MGDGPPRRPGRALAFGTPLSHLQAVYYREPNGAEPVREFVEALDDEEQAVIDNQIDRLNLLSDQMPHLPFPHSSQIDGELVSFGATGR
jgi:hypothetical protein